MSGSPSGESLGRSVLFDNPVVGHTRITHTRVWSGESGLFRFALITREGEWQLSTTVQYEKRFRPT